MKFLSLDIETTGLDESYCQVLEIGAVIGDLTESPVDDLPSLNLRLYYDKVVGEPFALAMNAKLIKDMVDRPNGPWIYCHPDSAWSLFDEWLTRHMESFSAKITVAGKNYATFDRRFLAKLPRWNLGRFHHRVIDPCNLFWQPQSDGVLPDTKLCIERAAIEWDPKLLHSAVSDARLVVELIRAGVTNLKGY